MERTVWEVLGRCVVELGELELGYERQWALQRLLHQPLRFQHLEAGPLAFGGRSWGQGTATQLLKLQRPSPAVAGRLTRSPVRLRVANSSGVTVV